MDGDLKLTELRLLLGEKTIEESLKTFTTLYPGGTIFTTSFGIEDQTLTHMIFNNDIPIDVVTLDTGRLFPETYRVFSDTIIKYQKKVEVLFPDHAETELMMTEKGPFSFYESKENRIECCRIRKVEPLNRALEGKKVWISGIRADQSDNRKKMEWLEYDEDKKILKFYPLFNWSYEQVRDFIKQNNVPYNTLHDTGFVSIGCEPCTRAIKPGEDFRAGRWWWENDGPKECGCHIK
jgi:phosphoadenosine phosphosulfate reductase